MALGTFSLAETFLAVHAFSWFSPAEDTAALAAEAGSAKTLWLWQASLTYVRNFRPSLMEHQIGSIPPGGRAHLTVDQGREALLEFIAAYNRLGTTETFLFASYVHGDPAAWPDWLNCLNRSA
jgi:hypothetical protein